MCYFVRITRSRYNLPQGCVPPLLRHHGVVVYLACVRYLLAWRLHAYLTSGIVTLTCNVCFIHVVEWADVIKFECWIFSLTFGIILYLGHVLCVQHRFQLSESWCMFLLSVYLQVQFCSGRHRAQWIVKTKMLNIFRSLAT